jgi:hypothetical protein
MLHALIWRVAPVPGTWDRGDCGPQLAGRSLRSSRIGPDKRCSRQERFWDPAKSPMRSPNTR